jgi:hypothetical protein
VEELCNTAVEKEARKWAEETNKMLHKEGVTDWIVKPDIRIWHLESMILSNKEDRKLIRNDWLVLTNRTSVLFHT